VKTTKTDDNSIIDETIPELWDDWMKIPDWLKTDLDNDNTKNPK
jgi:hypothetical protein